MIDIRYQNLLQTILEQGYKLAPAERQDVGSIQITSHAIYHDLREGFPLLTTKKIPFKNVVIELLWFLRGDTNIKYLVDNGCNIWNSDAYKYYLRLFDNRIKDNTFPINPLDFETFIKVIKTRSPERTNEIPNYIFGDLGPVYGKQWRKRSNFHFTTYPSGGQSVGTLPIDQISDLIKDIRYAVNNGYNNRRLIVDAWNPGETSQMALPPCHYGFQIILEPMSQSYQSMYYRDNSWVGEVPKYFLNLTWNQRSVDTFLGLPFNIASYALLAHILGRITNTVPKELRGNLSCVHLYDNHIEQAKEQIARKERVLPTLWMKPSLAPDVIDMDTLRFQNLTWRDFRVDNYDPHPAIKAEIVT